LLVLAAVVEQEQPVVFVYGNGLVAVAVLVATVLRADFL
jgi:hypothetical protein